MNVWILSGSLLAFLTYFPLWKQIRSDEDDTEQNFLTWFLWGTLDLIIAVTLIFQEGNFLLVSVYAVGGFTTAFFIWKASGGFSWTRFDLFVVFLVFVSMVVWNRSGEWMATIVSTIAMLIASIPQLVDAWKKPWTMPLMAFLSYFVANVLTTVGGQDWSVKERFYPATCVALCLLFVLFSARRFYLKPKQSSP